MTNTRSTGDDVRTDGGECDAGVRATTAVETGDPRGARRALDARFRAVARGFVKALQSEQAGQSMVEYAIVLFLVAVVAMVAVKLLGEGVDEVFRSILASFRSVLPAGGGGS